MPLYEYKCETCGDVFEVIQKFSDKALTTHEGCGGPVHRVLSAPALQFKGSGWYVTDYARGNGSNPNGKLEAKEGSGETAKAEKKESKTPTKPASGDK